MPAAVGDELQATHGLDYIEGYGLTETIAPTHINPPRSPEAAVPGHPDLRYRLARRRSRHAARSCRRARSARSSSHGPQVFQGYWNATPTPTRDAFIEIDGKRFFRTGDLGYVDEDGYFFLVDRLKRMINASGFKVWPAEVEAQMYQHPAIQEACVIAREGRASRRDGQGGRRAAAGARAARSASRTSSNGRRQNMAAYKHPRIVEFVDALPKSATGKVQWRELQEEENARAAAA